MERTETRNTEHLYFVGLDQRMAYRWFPGGPSGPQSTANAVLQGAIRTMAKYDDAVIAARRDVRLSPAGRAQQVASQRKAAAEEIVNATARANNEAQRVDAARAKLYAAPQLDPGDAVAAQIDAEVRARISSLPPAQLDSLRADIAAGREDRLLLALLRDPMPTPTRLWASALWAERVEAQHRAEVAALDIAAEDVAWATSTLEALKSVLDRSASFGLGPLQAAAAA